MSRDRASGMAPPYGSDPAADRQVAAALAGSAAASAAVSPVDTEPLPPASLAWRWVVGTHALDLHAVEPDHPQWRVTCLGAGEALHRARVALAAEGFSAHVTLLPGDEPAHLARLVSAGPVAVTPQALALYAATDPSSTVDSTDRPSTVEIRRGLRRELAGVAHNEGVRLRLIRVGGDLAGVLHGPDTRAGWLRAGAALSAVRLTCVRYGLRLTTTLPGPSSGVGGRAGRRRLSDREGWLGVGIGTPYARLRISPR